MQNLPPPAPAPSSPALARRRPAIRQAARRRARGPCPDAWAEAEIAALRRLWRAFLPVWVIARDLGRTRAQVQAMVRGFDLAHRDPAAVARAGRQRGAEALLRREREAEAESLPQAMSAAAAATLARLYGVAWDGRRADLARLNAALDRAGRRPAFVAFRELRP